MMKVSAYALAALVAAAPLGAAQLYRWVDDKGNVEWRDTPPPANATNVQQRSVSSNTIQTSTLPYSMQQAMKNFPVTLWAFDCGDACNRARGHLARRGVPYTERNAQKETEELKKVAGGTEVPVLLVGSRQLKGYLESDWDAALDGAGYPRTAPPGIKPAVQAKPAVQPADSQKSESAPPPR